MKCSLPHRWHDEVNIHWSDNRHADIYYNVKYCFIYYGEIWETFSMMKGSAIFSFYLWLTGMFWWADKKIWHINQRNASMHGLAKYQRSTAKKWKYISIKHALIGMYTFVERNASRIPWRPISSRALIYILGREFINRIKRQISKPRDVRRWRYIWR